MLKIELKKDRTYFVIPLICFALYVVCRDGWHFYFNWSAQLNYFRDLAFSFLHGRLDVSDTYMDCDLILYNDKHYLYWPPVPAIVYMPLVAIFGKNLPDGFISSLFAAASVWLIMKIVQLISKKFSLGLESKHIAWIGLFWGLGTVQFYMARLGSVWFISQIMAQTFLLASVYFLLKKSDDFKSLLLSGLFFGLAVYTRNDLVFAGFFFMGLYIAIQPDLSFKKYILNGLSFSIPFILFSFLNAWYNYARFGNAFDNGIAYHNMNPYFYENFRQYGYFSTHYLQYNFYVEVLKFPTLLSKSPFIEPDLEGFGFVWGSPVYLLLVPAFGLYLWNGIKRSGISNFSFLIKTGSLVSAIIIAFIIFSIMGTGWAQFCARYTLDFQFFLVIFLLLSWKDLSAAIPYLRFITIGLIVSSWIIQYIGVLTF